eukprot:gene7503-649_t
MQLSELVCEQEALQFQLVSEGLQAHVTYDSTVLGHSLVTDAVQEAADAALGSGAKAFIDGSIAKGTQWRGSDIDMLVQTDEPLTRSQVESLTEELKKSPMFNPRMLKVMASHALLPVPVKNYHLELLTLLSQEAAAARGGAHVADGSMQLVVDVLQAIADDRMPTAVAAETENDLTKDQFASLVRVSKGGAGDLIAHDTESETEPGAATRVAERGSELGSMTETESAHGSTAATGDPITHKTESEAEAGSMHGDMDGDRLFPDVLAHGSKAARGDPNTHKTESEVDPGSLHRDMDGDRLFPGLHAHVTLIYGQSRPGPFQRHFSSNHIAIVTGISVVMEDLALVVPHLLDSDTYHCIFLTDQAQLRACGCVFSSPTSPCIAINDSGTRCSLADCWFGPDKERAASAGIVVDNSAYLKAERCQFLRCCEAAVEVRGAGSKAQLKACTFTKCKKQAVVLYSGGEELVMEDCVIENCGDAVMRGLVQVACGKARLRKCSLVNNKTDGVVVQSESRQNAPVLDMSDCKLTGNSTGVLFGFGIGGGGGGSGVLDNNVITNNGTVGLIINEVAPNQLVHLSSNVFRSNGPTLLGAVDVQMFQNVKDQVVVKNNNCGAISCIPISAFDAVKFAKGLKLFK